MTTIGWRKILGSLGIRSVCKSRLNVLFNSCARYVYGIARFDHVSGYSQKIVGCTLEQYYKLRTCCFIFCLIQSQKPSYLYKQLIFSKSLRTKCLIIPRHNLSHTSSSFLVKSIIIWNSLPLFIRDTSSATCFKNICMKFKLSQQWSGFLLYIN